MSPPRAAVPHAVDVGTGQTLWTFTPPEPTGHVQMDWSPDHSQLAVANGGVVTVLDAQGNLQNAIEIAGAGSSGYARMHWLPGGGLLLPCSLGPLCYVPENGNGFGQPERVASIPNCYFVAVSTAGTAACAAETTGDLDVTQTLSLRDANGDETVAIPVSYGDGGPSPDWSSIGAGVVFVSGDETGALGVYVADPAGSLSVPDNAVRSDATYYPVAFAPDGVTIAAIRNDFSQGRTELVRVCRGFG